MTDATSPPPASSSSWPSDRNAFVERFGSVYEHSPWVAEAVWDRHPDHSRADLKGLQATMRQIVDDASADQKLQLIRQHPDLADPAAKAGELSDMSNREQMDAGLTDATDAESERFAQLNAAYKDKFGFPFVIAVKGLNRQQIIDAFEARLNNERSRELATALEQIHRIAGFRLADLFGS